MSMLAYHAIKYLIYCSDSYWQTCLHHNLTVKFSIYRLTTAIAKRSSSNLKLCYDPPPFVIPNNARYSLPLSDPFQC